MGGSKSIMDDNEWLNSLARSLLLEAKVLGYCEHHGMYFDTEAEIEGAFALADKQLREGKISLEGHSLADLHDAMREQLREHVSLDGCVRCEQERVA